jgi:acetyltransferase
MTMRNLDRLLKPGAVTLIGASRRPGSVGAVVARNLFHAGFDGPIMPVNPRERSIEGVLCYNSVAELPVTPDLAVICTPPPTVPGLIDELGRRGTRAAVVISAGFAESGEAGRRLQQEMLDAARPHLLRIIGPNCLGVMVPGRGLNASFVHVPPLKGELALVGQSGAVVTSIVDWAGSRGIGFSHLISLGSMADVDFGDLLDYLAADGGTRAILLYVEAITHARKFMSAARAAARQKPVILIKAGRTEEAARAAASHTGALAGSDAVYDAAFRRAGLLRVGELDELFDAAETLAMGVQTGGDRLAILTNGGGIGVLATDTLMQRGGRLARLGDETLRRLDGVLPATWSRGNPVDIIGDATGRRYADAMAALLDDEGADAILVLNCPTAVADSTEAAAAVIEALKGRRRPVLTSWLGEAAAVEARRMFATHRIPTYDTPGKAVHAFMHLVDFHRNRELLMETPASVPEQFRVDEAAARAVIEAALAQGRGWLGEFEAKQVLAAYGIPVVETLRAATPDEAMEAARRIGRPVALKILSPDITHKSDVGGVALRLVTPEEVRARAAAMLERVAALKPEARIEGFTVQEMVSKPAALELIVGMTEDVLFGPVILFGQGGVAVEVLQDHALGLPPLNTALAREMMSRTRVWRLMAGYRSQPAADADAVALTLIKVSQLVTDFPEVAEIDINPLLCDDAGVLALDARIRVAPPVLPGSKRLAIRPYPKRLERTVTLKDGRVFLVRPIRPEDEPLLHDMFERQTPDDIRLRFFAPIKRMSHQLAAKLTQIDYDREMALVAVAPGAQGREEIHGVVRITADPDNVEAEYAVMVRSDMKGQGLGFALMTAIMDYARSRGIAEIYGEVLRENTTMLAMCHELGFTRRESPDEPGVVEVRLRLAD